MAFELAILTPQGETWRGDVQSVVLPGSEGDFGVLPGHEAFFTPLRVGEVEIRTGTQTLYGAVAEGFADVSGQEVAVLVESCELSHEIDAARAELARQRAEQDLGGLSGDADAERATAYEAALQRARNRLAVSRRG